MRLAANFHSTDLQARDRARTAASMDEADDDAAGEARGAGGGEAAAGAAVLLEGSGAGRDEAGDARIADMLTDGMQCFIDIGAQRHLPPVGERAHGGHAADSQSAAAAATAAVTAPSGVFVCVCVCNILPELSALTSELCPGSA